MQFHKDDKINTHTFRTLFICCISWWISSNLNAIGNNDRRLGGDNIFWNLLQFSLKVSWHSLPLLSEHFCTNYKDNFHFFADPFDCSTGPNLRAHPQTCEYYIWCVETRYFSMLCPKGLYFDPQLGYCNYWYIVLDKCINGYDVLTTARPDDYSSSALWYTIYVTFGVEASRPFTCGWLYLFMDSTH